MSSKRRADKELTSDNWDDEDEPEECGTFRKASEDVLKSRVIRTAKRRVTNGVPYSEQSSIFSGFTGFGNKIDDRKSSFSFVSNLKATDDVAATLNTNKKPTISFDLGSSSMVNEVPKPSFSLLSSSSNIPSTEPSKSTQSTFSIKYGIKANTTDSAENLNNTNKLSTLSNKLKIVVNEEESVQKQDPTSIQADVAKTPDEIFFKKLRSLNLLCAEWIIKHLNENLSYILTPIFDDYKKHLTQLREERRLAGASNKKMKIEVPEMEVSSGNKLTQSKSLSEPSSKTCVPEINFGTSALSKKVEKTTQESFKSPLTLDKEKTTDFKFFSSVKEDDSLKTCATTDSKFDRELFKFNVANTNETKSSNGNADPIPPTFFSFKPVNTSATNSFFSHSSIQKSDETTENDDDGPPPVEDITIKEEGSVYDKKCKIFIKKDGNFIDHGVGFLFLKLVGDEKKCQVIVRANNKLANIIINVLLTSNIPVQKMGKNNVMIVCCPTPEMKQPTSILVKVKTSDDAEELLNNLNKYRK